MTPRSQPLPAVVHVDMDGAREVFGAHGWSYTYPDDPIFESGVLGALDLFDRNSIRATFFAVANSLDDDRKKELLQEVVRRGHEVASHTLTHPQLPGLTREQQAPELRDSRDRLNAELGVPIRGFRAPGYNLNRDSIELLDEFGYEYDSSVSPKPRVASSLGTTQEQLLLPGRPFRGIGLRELPLPDYRPSPVPFSPSYALLLGLPFFRWGVRRIGARKHPFILLFHLIDLAEPLQSDRLPNLMARIFTLSNISAASKRRRAQLMLDYIAERFQFTTTLDLLNRADPTPAGRSDRPAER